MTFLILHLRRLRRFIIYISLAVIIAVVTTIVINATGKHSDMDNLEDKIALTETKITITEYVAFFALAITLIAAGFALTYHNQLGDLRKGQRTQDEMKVASASATAEKAILGQKEAELKTKQVELELAQLHSTVKETKEITDYTSKKVDRAQKIIVPRILTTEQENRLIELLRNIPNESIDFKYVSGDMEAFDFCNQLVSVFTKSGWKINGIGSFLGDEFTGIVLEGRSKTDLPVYTEYIQDAFYDVDFPAPLGISGRTNQPKMVIKIGHKPNL